MRERILPPVAKTDLSKCHLPVELAGWLFRWLAEGCHMYPRLLTLFPGAHTRGQPLAAGRNACAA